MFLPLRGPRGGVDLVEVCSAFGFILRPACIGVRHDSRTGCEELPGVPAREGNRDHGLTQFGAPAAIAKVIADDGLEDDNMFAASRFKVRPVFAIAGWCKTEVGSQVQITLGRADVPVSA